MRSGAWRRLIAGSGALLAATVLLFQTAAPASAVTVSEVSAGMSHTCARLADGTVDCWGADEWGQLGDGTTIDSPVPVPVFGLAHVTQISAGGSHSCALLAGGTVDCWGENSSGELGDGTTTSISTPVTVSGLTNVRAISAGLEHTCALLADETVDCWGAGSSGQLGAGDTESHSTPVPVSGLAGVGTIAAGWNHTCAGHLEGGEVECWGNDSGGQLGDGSTTNSPVPVPVPGVTAASQLGAGDLYTCAVVIAEVECWGQLNPEGETTNPNPTPEGLAGPPIQLAVGGFHACALLIASVECWGNDTSGQLGNGVTGGELEPPAPVAGLVGAQLLTAGGFHTCAMVNGGEVECWGANESGQLGDGSSVFSAVPVRVTFPEPAPEKAGASPAPTPGTVGTAPPATASSGPPAPVFGKRVSLSRLSGSVLVKLPGHRGFVPLASVSSVPLATEVDTSGGKVELLAATGTKGGTQAGRFDGGLFRVTQKLSRSPFQPGRIGLTVLTLTGPAPSCGGGTPGAARASTRRRGGNHLWGEDDHGNFQTGGHFASATVGGTKWLTAETCAGTRVTVARGVVSVTDKVRHRTVTVKAHHSYLARRAGSG